MATKTKIIDAEMVPDEEHESYLDSFLQSPSRGPALDAVFSELGIENGEDAKVFVSIINHNNTGKEARIWDGPPEEYDLRRLSRAFGSGDYRVKLYTPSETGNARVSRANKVITVLLTPQEERELKQAKEPLTGQYIPQAAPAMDVQVIANAVAIAVRAAMPPPAPAIDPMAMFAQIATLMRTLTPAPVSNGLGSIKEVIEVATLLNSGSAKTGDTNGLDVIMNLAEKFAPPLVTAYMANKAETAQVNQQALQLPAPAPAPASFYSPIETPENIKMKIEDDLKRGINFLLPFAKKQLPTETYAGLVLDMLEPEVIEHWLKQSDEDILKIMSELVPEVTIYAPWFTTMIVDMREMCAPEVDEKAPDEIKIVSPVVATPL